MFSDFFDHLLVVLAVRVGVVGEDFFGYVVSFPVADNTAGDQIQFRVGTGEV